MKTKSTEEEEFQVLPTVAPRVNLGFTDAWAVRHGNLDGFLFAKVATGEDFDFLTERHTVVGRSHLFVLKDGFAEDPHAGLGIFDAVPEQHTGGEGQHPIPKAVEARHGTVFCQRESVAGDEIKVVIKKALDQFRHQFCGVGAVSIHGYDDVVFCHVKARAVGPTVAFSWLEVYADVLLKGDFSGAVAGIAVDDHDLEVLAPSTRDGVNGWTQRLLFVSGWQNHGDRHR